MNCTGCSAPIQAGSAINGIYSCKYCGTSIKIAIDKNMSRGNQVEGINGWLAANIKRFPSGKRHLIGKKLASLPQDKVNFLRTLNLLNPVVVTIISFYVGGIFGADRFMVGDKKLGALKLLTFGGFGMWYMFDIFIIGHRAKAINYNRLMQYLGDE